MKIQTASELHFELWERYLPDPLHQFTPDTSGDVLILAGNIVDGKRIHGNESGHDEEGNQQGMQEIVAGVSAKRDDPLTEGISL